MAKDISKAYGSNIVFAGVNLAIDKGSRVVILGCNGAGKTTTLRLLAHIEEPDTGSVEYGHGCKIGYFAQEHDTFGSERHRVGEPGSMRRPSSITRRPVRFSARSCSPVTTR